MKTREDTIEACETVALKLSAWANVGGAARRPLRIQTAMYWLVNLEPDLRDQVKENLRLALRINLREFRRLEQAIEALGAMDRFVEHLKLRAILGGPVDRTDPRAHIGCT